MANCNVKEVVESSPFDSEYVQIITEILQNVAECFGLTFVLDYAQVNDRRANTVGRLRGIGDFFIPDDQDARDILQQHDISYMTQNGCILIEGNETTLATTWTNGTIICLTCFVTGICQTFDIADPNSIQNIKSFIATRYFPHQHI